MGRHRIVSITPALAGQDLGAILADLFSVERLLDSPKRSDQRVAAVTLVSAAEQFCRLAVADLLGRGMGTMPDYVEIPLASIGPAARLSREALVSFSYNFQNVRTIEKALANHGIRDVFGGYPGLRDAMVALIAARHDLVHTSIPVRFNMRASYDAVVGLAFGIARHLPELEADMRLAEGDIFHRMRMPGRSRAGYEKAEPLCRALALKNPESAQAHARLGLALAGLGRHGEALASCDRAALLDPGRAAAHLGRALQLAKLGRHGDALAGCGRAAEADPSLPDPHMIGADMLAGMGRHAEALAAATGPPGSTARCRGRTFSAATSFTPWAARPMQLPRTTRQSDWTSTTRWHTCAAPTCWPKRAAPTRRLPHTTRQSRSIRSTQRRTFVRQFCSALSVDTATPCAPTAAQSILIRDTPARRPVGALFWRTCARTTRPAVAAALWAARGAPTARIATARMLAHQHDRRRGHEKTKK